MTREEYIAAHTSAPSAELDRLYRHTYLTRLYPRMCCDPHQGRLLTMLTRMIRPRRILELGAFSGYSTLCFAEGMPAGAELHTVEIDDEAAPGLLEVYRRSPRSADIHLHVGDALELISTLGGNWDLVYIDANKRHYLQYYQLLKPLISPGGYIIADNTIWSDAVVDPESHSDAQTRGIREFNDAVAADPDAFKVMLPLYDGMTIITFTYDEEKDNMGHASSESRRVSRGA